MLSITKNPDFLGNPFSFLTDAYSIVQLPDTLDGQNVLQIVEYTHSTNPNDSRFNKPEIKAIITGFDLELIATPNGNYPSLGQTLTFTDGIISSIVINDYVGTTLSNLGTPREIYVLTGGAIDHSVLNQSPEAVDTALSALAGGSNATAGDDVIHGTSGNDTIDGLAGNDMIYGNDGHDNLFGGSGNDFLVGGRGADINNGGSGIDTVSYCHQRTV